MTKDDYLSILFVVVVACLFIYFTVFGGCRHGYYTGDPRWYECVECGHREGVVGGLFMADDKRCFECGGYSRVVERLSKEEWDEVKDRVTY